MKTSATAILTAELALTVGICCVSMGCSGDASNPGFPTATGGQSSTLPGNTTGGKGAAQPQGSGGTSAMSAGGSLSLAGSTSTGTTQRGGSGGATTSSQGGANSGNGGRATGGSSAGGSSTGGRTITGGSGGSTGKGGNTPGVGGASGNAGSSSSAGGTPATSSTHLYTKGGDLLAHCGEKVLLRGVNQMSVWTDPTGSSYPAIASFGTNSIRIVYQTSGSAAGLDALLTKAEANKLIPMPELHDATGKFDGVGACVNWWTKPDVVSVIKKHEKWTLLNIANEAGDGSVSNATFESTYKSAIAQLRNAGITVPIVIDGTGWGQNVEQLLATAPALLASDPQKNVIFSWHEYTGGSQQNARITTSYEKSKALGIVLINGEFASAGAGACTPNIPYKFLLAEAQRVGIGWFAWSWDVGNSDCKSGGTSVFDMTTNITSASAVVSGWPSDVMRDDPNSIKNTSVRPCEWK